jgi:hypothetical protein
LIPKGEPCHKPSLWAITDLSLLLAGNHLSHNIAARLPLMQIAEAHDLVERGWVMGNVVLEVE